MPKPPVATQVAIDEMPMQETPHGDVTGSAAGAVPEILQEPLPPPNPEADIHILPAGYDYQKLEPVVEALASFRLMQEGTK